MCEEIAEIEKELLGLECEIEHKWFFSSKPTE